MIFSRQVFKKPQGRTPEDVLQGAYSQANIMKYVGHENIVTMYDAYFETDNLYVVMELCRGDDLFQWLCDRLQLQVKHDVYAFAQMSHFNRSIFLFQGRLLEIDVRTIACVCPISSY
jgi:serine/threonine protein kinase